MLNNRIKLSAYIKGRKTVKRKFKLADPKPIFNVPTYDSDYLPIVWHGSLSAFNHTLVNYKHQSFYQITSSLRKGIFPKSKDKDKSKKNYKFSAFSKLWQREYAARFFTALTVQNRWLYNKLNNLGRGHRLRDMQIKHHHIDYRYKFWTFFNRSILGFLVKHFCNDFKLAVAFIKSGLVFINGISTRDPFSMVHKLSLVKINLPFLYFSIFELLRWKLQRVKFKAFVEKPFFLRFAPSTEVEVSFKLGELFLLPLMYQDTELKRSILELHFSPALLFSQRFFPKQKKFGLGRLI